MAEWGHEVLTFVSLAGALAWLTVHWARRRRARACSGCTPPAIEPPHQGVRSRSLRVLTEGPDQPR